MADFLFPIHRMTPEPPHYNVLITQMEGMRIKRRLKSSAPYRRWTIEMRGRTNDERDAILAHWDEQVGPMIPFNWYVPEFFGGEVYYVVYETMNYENPVGMGNIWDFTCVFREEIT